MSEPSPLETTIANQQGDDSTPTTALDVSVDLVWPTGEDSAEVVDADQAPTPVDLVWPTKDES